IASRGGHRAHGSDDHLLPGEAADLGEDLLRRADRAAGRGDAVDDGEDLRLLPEVGQVIDDGFAVDDGALDLDHADVAEPGKGEETSPALHGGEGEEGERKEGDDQAPEDHDEDDGGALFHAPILTWKPRASPPGRPPGTRAEP